MHSHSHTDTTTHTYTHAHTHTETHPPTHSHARAHTHAHRNTPTHTRSRDPSTRYDIRILTYIMVCIVLLYRAPFAGMNRCGQQKKKKNRVGPHVVASHRTRSHRSGPTVSVQCSCHRVASRLSPSHRTSTIAARTRTPPAVHHWQTVTRGHHRSRRRRRHGVAVVHTDVVSRARLLHRGRGRVAPRVRRDELDILPGQRVRVEHR